MRTTLLFGALAHAVLILAAVGVANAVLQAVVTQFAHPALGMPPGTPAFVQSVARAEGRMPDHDCPYKQAEESSNIETRADLIAGSK
jgi:hypothetical protein